MRNLKTYIYHNPHKEQAVNFRQQFESCLVEESVSTVDSIEDADFFVVIGGDGTLLNFSKYIIEQPKPVLAVNMGSLGFLTDVRVDEARFAVRSIVEKNYSTENRRFLEIRAAGSSYYALNDFVVAKCGLHARMVSIVVTSNGEYVNTYRADGVIIATPTGSTAYSFSTGGPIVKPGLDAVVITPIAPHNLNARPIVVPGSDIIELYAESEESDLHSMVDGQCSLALGGKERVQVTLSDKYIQLVKAPSRGYYSILRQKLKWGDKLC
ncbi:MAG: NAD(+)/NADH kinase [Spirochaetes bacterium]|nr:NAD(+)/NADH kinase [Spirochaetota bacterium]MBN2771575.1 NAD(+)/NADH kinase [Spirochaetota bacterium]